MLVSGRVFLEKNMSGTWWSSMILQCGSLFVFWLLPYFQKFEHIPFDKLEIWWNPNHPRMASNWMDDKCLQMLQWSLLASMQLLSTVCRYKKYICMVCIVVSQAMYAHISLIVWMSQRVFFKRIFAVLLRNPAPPEMYKTISRLGAIILPSTVIVL